MSYLNLSPFTLLQASLVLIQASEDTPKPEPKTDPEVIEDAREARQYGPYGPYPSANNEVVVDIQDDEKKQYYETNYDTSETLLFHIDLCHDFFYEFLGSNGPYYA